MQQDRRHDIDALRVFAFGLLILYHVAMFYVADWGWHIKSAYQSEWLQLPMQLVNQWRMPLLFIISGLAVSFVWPKYTARAFAGRRVIRLLVPLVFGMAFIVAPQCYYEALGKGLIEPGYGRFLLQYLAFRDFPGDAWGGENYIVWTWNHLWYLLYLLFYTLLLIPLAKWLDGRGRFLREAFCGLRGAWIVLVPVAVLMVYGNFVFPRFPYVSHAFFDDWYAHAMYGTLFLIGYLVGRDSGFWAELSRLRHYTLAGAAVFFGLFLGREHFLAPDTSWFVDQVNAFVVYMNRWLWIVTIFGWGHHVLNRPMKWLPYATEAVYPWYILHQTITIVVAAQLARFSLGPVLEPLLVLGGTLAGCFLVHEYLVRPAPLLRPLFGLAASTAASRSFADVYRSCRAPKTRYSASPRPRTPSTEKP